MAVTDAILDRFDGSIVNVIMSDVNSRCSMARPNTWCAHDAHIAHVRFVQFIQELFGAGKHARQ